MSRLKRLFTTQDAKGTFGYLDSQKKYELARTVLYFGISLSLLGAGIAATGTKVNLLTIVAVLGCLPACKSLVSVIMFFRFHSCPKEAAEQIERARGSLTGLYDMVFTSYDRNYEIAHLCIGGGRICCYTRQKDFPRKPFQAHLEGILKAEHYPDISVSVFTDLNKYTERLSQLQDPEREEPDRESLALTLKSVAL